MPSFNGANIFGTAVSMNTLINPVERQENPYPGLSGVQSLPMGQRGGFTNATGLLSGASAAELFAAEALFRSYYDGNAYTLVDTFGAAWSDVILESFEPQGRVKQSPFGGYFRPYAARFRHLTVS